jgi:hypothetical protein
MRHGAVHHSGRAHRAAPNWPGPVPLGPDPSHGPQDACAWVAPVKQRSAEMVDELLRLVRERSDVVEESWRAFHLTPPRAPGLVTRDPYAVGDPTDALRDQPPRPMPTGSLTTPAPSSPPESPETHLEVLPDLQRGATIGRPRAANNDPLAPNARRFSRLGAHLPFHLPIVHLPGDSVRDHTRSRPSGGYADPRCGWPAARRPQARSSSPSAAGAPACPRYRRRHWRGYQVRDSALATNTPVNGRRWMSARPATAFSTQKDTSPVRGSAFSGEPPTLARHPTLPDEPPRLTPTLANALARLIRAAAEAPTTSPPSRSG